MWTDLDTDNVCRYAAAFAVALRAYVGSKSERPLDVPTARVIEGAIDNLFCLLETVNNLKGVNDESFQTKGGD